MANRVKGEVKLNSMHDTKAVGKASKEYHFLFGSCLKVYSEKAQYYELHSMGRSWSAGRAKLKPKGLHSDAERPWASANLTKQGRRRMGVAGAKQLEPPS